MLEYVHKAQAIRPIIRILKGKFPRAIELGKACIVSLEQKYIRLAFTRIYKTNAWGGRESVSGQGSSLVQTAVLRRELPSLLRSLGVRTLLDAPCGDHFWMKEVSLDLDLYIGGDIVRQIIKQNRLKYGCQGKSFLVLDVTKDRLPRVDCILCRDCLDHFSFHHIACAIENFRRSGAEYLLATIHTARTKNDDILTGGFRPINWLYPPFCFPEPRITILEQCTELGGRYFDKSLALWRIADLPMFKYGA
jgi:hypothetical protein